MLTFSVQSGSCGNCYYYESGDVRLLFDAGLSWRRASERIRGAGARCDGVSAVFISHDHSDHVGAAGTFHRMTKAPLFLSRGTADAAHVALGKVKAREVFEAGDTVTVGHVKVHTIPTPHDAADPVAFIVDDGRTRVGVLTDLGHGFPALRACLASLDVAYLESNYDEEMLAANTGYPEHLKRRIRGRAGHLENREAAMLVREGRGEGRLRHVLLSHLSQDNNSPATALRVHGETHLPRDLFDAPFPTLLIAPRDRASAVVSI